MPTQTTKPIGTAQAVGGSPRRRWARPLASQNERPQQDEREPDDRARVLREVESFRRIRVARPQRAEASEPLDDQDGRLLGQGRQGIVREVLLARLRHFEPMFDHDP